MVGALAVGLTNGETHERALKVVPTATFKRVIVPTARPASIYSSPRPTPTAPKIPEGIFEYGQAPWPQMLYQFKNQWHGNVNGHPVYVYAGQLGYETNDNGRGVIWLDSSPAERGASFRAPLGVGSLRIVSYEGLTLALQAETGETFHLDVDKRQFTDATGDAVPTDTPTPIGYIPPKPTSRFATPIPAPLDATPTPTPIPGNPYLR